jgi:spore coat protein U-like protein
MNLKPLALIAALGLHGGLAHAAINCTSVTSPGFSMNYVANTTMSAQTYFTVTCTRNRITDATSIDYTVAVNNGGNNNGGNRAKKTVAGTNYFVSYDTYRNSGCTTTWASNGSARIADTISWSSSNDFSSVSKDTAYWGCVTTTQTGMPAGQYDDSLTLSLRVNGSNTVTDTGTATVKIFAPANCSMSMPPGTINFNYTAFGGLVGASTSFAVNCTTLMPYTLSLNSTTGAVLGLNYTLGLSSASGTGTGGAQPYTISGSMAAGQSGICSGASCTASQPHTVTIGY